jgi:hypothetical protein
MADQTYLKEEQRANAPASQPGTAQWANERYGHTQAGVDPSTHPTQRIQRR